MFGPELRLAAVDTAVILAGGLGTRLRSVVPDLPKPMAPIAGRPFLEYQLDYWIGQGIRRFVLSVGYRHDLIVDHFKTRYKGAGIAYAIESSPLGTGGGLLCAVREARLDAPFLLLNGDTYFEADMKALEEFAEANDADWCLCLAHVRETGRYMGLVVSPQGRILSLRSGAAGADRLANGGVYRVHPRALREEWFATGRKISLEDDVLPAALAHGRPVFGIEVSGTFLDIGVPDDYHRAASVLLA